jgi:YbbR domain-containing protein
MKSPRLVSPLRAWLADALTENVGYKVLALGLAVTVWAGVASEKVVEKRTRARVDYVWPERLARVDEAPKTVVLTVQGPQGLLSRLPSRELHLSVDLSEAELGATSVDFTERTIQGLPAGVSVIQVSPPAVDVQFDRKLTRSVRVKPVTIGEPDPRCKLVSVKVAPEVVEIAGAQSLVRGISEAPTDIVDVGGLCEDRTVQVALALKDRTVGAVGVEQVEVSLDFEPLVADRVFEEVPVIVRGTGWLARPRLARVTVTGPVAAVANLDPDGVVVRLDLPERVEPGAQLSARWDLDPAKSEVDVVVSRNKEIVVSALQPQRFELVPE